MPGRVFLTASAGEVAGFLSAEPPRGAEFSPRLNIAPGQDVWVCPPDRRLCPMRWGIVPVGRKNARGRPVMETLVNVRGETLFEKSAFEGFRRAILPVNGWYEWTGPPRRKTAWRISPKGGGLMAFAAVWDSWTAPGGRDLLQVATVTCEPSAQIAPIHHRMGVILPRERFEDWLTGDAAIARALIRPAAEGVLSIEEAAGVDWTAP